VLWSLAVLAHAAAVWGARRLAVGALLVSVVWLGVGVAFRAPLPSTLGELRQSEASPWQALAASDWLCSALPLVEQREHGHVA
jgi:hypothetical protein